MDNQLFELFNKNSELDENLFKKQFGIVLLRALRRVNFETEDLIFLFLILGKGVETFSDPNWRDYMLQIRNERKQITSDYPSKSILCFANAREATRELSFVRLVLMELAKLRPDIMKSPPKGLWSFLAPFSNVLFGNLNDEITEKQFSKVYNENYGLIIK